MGSLDPGLQQGQQALCGLRLRHSEEQQVFRASAQWPHHLSRRLTPHRAGCPVRLDSSGTQKKHARGDLGIVSPSWHLLVRGFTHCTSSDHHRQFVEGRAGPADPILRMGSLRLRRFGDSSQATQKGRCWVLLPTGLIPFGREDVGPVALWEKRRVSEAGTEART